MPHRIAEWGLGWSLLVTVMIALLAPYSNSVARDSDRDQPIKLSANQAEIDNVKGVSVYRGDVVLTQGTLRITGEVMHIYYAPDSRALDRIIVEGHPATYRELPEGESEYVHAKAPRMEYYETGPRRIRLLQGATLWQGSNTFRGNQVVYDIEADHVEAHSGKDKTKRIHITIYPNQPHAKQAGEGR
ncbi:MAG: lipopolysaccharide transport periplasmic protein LptA [Nitrococcus mobilis]|nr:lipopolysaccharide transport periplasmic protein LptA [Nitrococcus mobilis]